MGRSRCPVPWDDARAIFSDEGPRWHFLTRPRGGSKTTDLAGVALSWLAVEAAPGERGYVVASDRDQAALLIDAAAGLIDGTPALAAVLSVNAYKITAQSGATVDVIPADGASAFGLRPSLVVVDEFAQWPETRNARRVWTALISSVGKVPGCPLIVLTSAGEPSHWSFKIIQEARNSSDWRVNEVPGPLPWLDPAEIDKQRPLLRDSEFARLHLNQWTQAEDRLVSAADLGVAAVLDGPLEPQPGVRYVVTLDVGLTNDACVAVVAHAEQRGDDKAEARRLVVDRIARWHGTKSSPVSLDEVEAWVATSSANHNRAPVHADPWQAAGVLQRLAKRGVIAEQFVFSSTSVGRVAQALHLALRNRLIWLPKDDDLLSELSRVRLRETSLGVVRLDHDSGQHDDQAVAIGIAVAVLLGNEMSSAAKDWIESMAPEQEAANDNHGVGWRWKLIPEPAFAPETAATLAMLRTLDKRF
ncbi:MAG: terminase large subunit [Acidimicrobiales bacterium]